ncbi:MAG: metal-dependent hydrolase [Phycisphaerae bacterium]
MSSSITWLGHATFRLVLPDERVVFIDPWLAENPSCPDDQKKPSRCDMILLTHGHFDHTADVKSLVEQFNPTVIASFELCSILEAQLSAGRFSGMNTGGTQTVDGVRVSLTQAFHSSSVDSPNGPIYAGMPNGVVVATDDLATIYHAGDTDVFGDMRLIRDVFQPRVCILPIGDHFTMGAAGAALAADMLRPEVIIPCHYKTFPILAQSADDFRAALPAELESRLIVPEVGRSLAWTASGIG